jgi:hypothetical protein
MELCRTKKMLIRKLNAVERPWQARVQFNAIQTPWGLAPEAGAYYRFDSRDAAIRWATAKTYKSYTVAEITQDGRFGCD